MSEKLISEPFKPWIVLGFSLPQTLFFFITIRASSPLREKKVQVVEEAEGGLTISESRGCVSAFFPWHGNPTWPE